MFIHTNLVIEIALIVGRQHYRSQQISSASLGRLLKMKIKV